MSESNIIKREKIVAANTDEKDISQKDNLSVISSALSGMTGGSLLLSFLGVPGVIAGGMLGAIVTGI